MQIPKNQNQPKIVSMFDWKQKMTDPLTGEKLRIMSWNILAERLISQQFFPYVKPEHLSYDYRIDLIKKFISFYNCEIVCLQEVDSSKSFFSFLEQMGYEYRYRPKGPLQGILIAFKKSLFQILDQKYVDYDSLIGQPFKKQVYSTGHGAILLKLMYKGVYKLIVANTHLFWVPRFERIKYHQVCSVLTSIRDFAENDPNCFKFLLGDFNSTPAGNCVKLITQNSPPQFDICFEPRCNYREMYQKYQQNDTNLIRLNSVFTPEDCRFTNLTNKFRGVIDYIFHQEHEELQVQKVLGFPSEQSLKKQVALPNSIVPSDHLPLVCDFRLQNPQE